MPHYKDRPHSRQRLIFTGSISISVKAELYRLVPRNSKRFLWPRFLSLLAKTLPSAAIGVGRTGGVDISRGLIYAVGDMRFGCRSEVGRIERLLLKHPRQAFISPENVERQWKMLHFTACPDYAAALREYDAFVALLEDHVPEIHFLPGHPRTGLDSLYVHDPAVVTARGAVLANMGKKARTVEPRAMAATLSELGVPTLGSITGEGRLEGGDVVIFDEMILAVGRGERTNAEGIRQLRMLLGDMIQELVVVPLPHWKGPGDVLHLMSLISPVDHDLAVVYSPLLPPQFLGWLVQQGIELVEVPDQEYTTMGCNVLALAPRKCLMLAGNPVTKQRLEQRDVEVLEYEGNEISHKGAGGPTCLTRPIFRSD